MQKKTKQSNQKQQDAVQDVPAKNSTKTPRASFICNPALSEMIYKANLLSDEVIVNLKAKVENPEFGKDDDCDLNFFSVFPDETVLYLFNKSSIQVEDLSLETVTLALKRLAKLEEIKKFLNDIFILSLMLQSAVETQLVESDGQDFLGLMHQTYLDLRQSEELPTVEDYAIFGIEETDFPPKFSDQALQFVDSVSKLNDLIKSGEKEDARQQLELTKEQFTKLSREFLLDEAKIEDRVYENKSQLYGEDIVRLTNLTAEVYQRITATDVLLDTDGNISFQLSPYAQALQGVNISRLRKCDVCEKFFWASRKDAYTCSKQHAKTRQMRLLRKNWKEKGHSSKGGYLNSRKKTKKNIQEE